MALKKLKEVVAKRTDPAQATLYYKGEPAVFSRPRVFDLQPTRDQLDEIGRNFPSLRPDQLLYVHMMGRGYIPEPSEGAVVAWKELAEIAQDNDLIFADLIQQWEKAFPEFTDWTAARFSAKNDSGAQGDLGTESPTLPPASENSPESLGV